MTPTENRANRQRLAQRLAAWEWEKINNAHGFAWIADTAIQRIRSLLGART